MPTSRRQFFGLLGAATVAAAAAPSTALGRREGVVGDTREAFAFDEDHVPMNAANLCPSPRRVADAVTRYTALIDADCSFQNRDRFKALREASRSAIADMLRASPEEIALVRNTSEANNIVSAGLDLAAGDEVLLWDQNHSSNNVAWDVRAARSGFSVRRISLPPHPGSEDDLLAPFIDAMTPRTRVLSVTHISNVSGLRVPITALADLCRERGIHFHVDGAQTWGAFDLDLSAVACDSFSASAHKWFLGPKEVGILFVRHEAQERVWPGVVSYDWGNEVRSALAGARKFESLGQRDDAAIAALAEAARLHGDLGPAAVAAHIKALATQLKEGLVEAGFELVTPMDARFSGGVCIAAVAPAQRGALFDGLYRRHGIIGAPTGGLRLCPHVYNTAEHVERAVRGAGALRRAVA